MLQEIIHNILILLSQEALKIKWRRGHYVHNHLLTHSANRESVQNLFLDRRGGEQARRARQPVTLGYTSAKP